MRFRDLLLALTMVLVCLDAPAAEKRIALVIGNSTYGPEYGMLRGVSRDAALVARTLTQLGFEVRSVANRNVAQMRIEISSFAGQLADAGDDGVGFFYYAGHGAADRKRGENYLLAVDSNATTAAQLPLGGIGLGEILDALEGARAKAAIVVIDSCRDVPTATSRSISRGMLRTDARTGTFVVFATQPGATASDDGLFAKYLTEALLRPNATTLTAFSEIKSVVAKASQGSQIPRIDDGLVDPLRLALPEVVVPRPNTPPVKPVNASLQAAVATQPVIAPAASAQSAISGPFAGEFRRRQSIVTGKDSGLTAGQILSPSGRVVASVEEERLLVWDVDTKKLLLDKNVGRTYCGKIDEQDRQIICNDHRKGILPAIFDLKTGAMTHELPDIGAYASFRFSPTARFLASRANTGILTIYDLQQKKVALQLKPEDTRSTIYQIDFSPGRDVVAIADNETVWILDLTTDKVLKSTKVSNVKYLRYSLDANYLAWQRSTPTGLLFEIWNFTSDLRPVSKRVAKNSRVMAFDSVSGDALLEDGNKLVHWNFNTGRSRTVLSNCDDMTLSQNARRAGCEGNLIMWVWQRDP